MTPPEFNLADYFVDRHVREGRGEKIAVLCEGQSFTYSEIAARVNRAANGLRRRGIERQERVMILLPDGPEFIAAYLGAIKCGAVAVPTNTSLGAGDYVYLLDESQAAGLIVDDSIRAQIDCSGRKFLRHVFASHDFENEPAEFAAEGTLPDDVAFWLWTSGSTGSPKGAVHR
jgi:acyl-coenzyme A synthetase/AMP-(fatty) acid ligase